VKRRDGTERPPLPVWVLEAHGQDELDRSQEWAAANGWGRLETMIACAAYKRAQREAAWAAEDASA
jgi:transcription elongation factor